MLSNYFSERAHPRCGFKIARDASLDIIKMADADTVTASRLLHEITLEAWNAAPEWAKAAPILFCSDWQGKNADPGRQTEARLLWTPETLYLRFECRYRELFVFDDSEADRRRDHLWDRDVAEVFIQPDPEKTGYYKEFEVGPNGMWIDLDIFPGGRRDLRSGVRQSVWLDRQQHTWAVELAIPMKALEPDFNPRAQWRANFYRVEGAREPRFYSAWRPTCSPQPNFHVPAAFGKLRFEE